MSQAAGLGLQRQDKATPGKGAWSVAIGKGIKGFSLGFAPSGSLLCKQGRVRGAGSISWVEWAWVDTARECGLMLCSEIGPNCHL